MKKINDKNLTMRYYSSKKIIYKNNKNNIENTNFVEPIFNNIKCPICNKICLVNINKKELTVTFRCNNNNCNYNKIQNNIYTCPKNYVKRENNEYLDNSEIFCQNHPKLKNNLYCIDCKENFCEQCIKFHENHQKIELNNIRVKENEVFIIKIKAREKFEKFSKVLNDIINWKIKFENGINSLINIMRNIYNLKNFLIMNYDKKFSYNYNYIQNFNNIKDMDINIPELDKFFESSEFKEKGNLLMEAITNIKNIININDNNNDNYNVNNQLIISPLFKSQDNLKKYFSNNMTSKNKKENILKKYENIYSNYSRRVEKIIYKGNKIIKEKRDKEKDKNNSKKIDKNYENRNLSTIEQNENLEKKILNLNLDKNLIKKLEVKNKEHEERRIYDDKKETEEKKIDIDIKEENNSNKNNISKNVKIDNLDNNTNPKYRNIDNNTSINMTLSINENNKIYQNENDNTVNEDNLDNGRIEDMTSEIITKNSKLFIEVEETKKEERMNENILELKKELKENDIIKSVEIINNNEILVCTPKSLKIYKIKSEQEIDAYFIINDYNNINYGNQLSSGDLIICLTNKIIIFKIIENEQSLIKNFLIIQELKSKNNNSNINKVIEIKNKNALISCDNNNLILYKKNNLNELYNEIKNIKINEEIKNINYINENIFCIIQPENESVTFYDVEDLNDNNLVIKNIQTEFGRYNVKNVEKYNCVFIAGLFGIYTISTVKYAIISFFLLNERISCIDYDFINNYLICGSIKKNSNNKNYNLILFNIKQEKSENNTFDEINIFEKERINNVHHDDIIVIQNSRDGFILTGSNDKTIKIWKEIIGK